MRYSNQQTVLGKARLVMRQPFRAILGNQVIVLDACAKTITICARFQCDYIARLYRFVAAGDKKRRFRVSQPQPMPSTVPAE